MPARAQKTAVAEHGRLHVQGNRILDEHGNPVVLRGMSLFWTNERPQFYNAAAIRWLRDDWNANVVRTAMSVHFDGYLKDPAGQLKLVETVIDAAIADGMYVIVDWHAHQPEAGAAGEFFEHIARKYGKYPNIIYETWNEPLDKHDWSTVIKPYHLAVIPHIRKYDRENLIVAGTQTWSQDVDKAAADPLPDRNLAYTLHFYAATHKEGLRQKARAALAKGAALFVTEWGTVEASGTGYLDQAETAKWIAFMDENQLSWAVWSITDKNETSAALFPGATATGGWPDSMITPSGKLVRAELRAKNPPASGAKAAPKPGKH